jgi:arginine decarboxylase-like protein
MGVVVIRVRMCSITYMTTRKNRQTKTTITVTQWSDQWFTICEDHEVAVGHENKTQARSWAAEPLVWCAGCQATHNNEGNK